MHRAQKFITDAREEALELMGKGLRNLHPKEIDLIVALCDAHNETCEMVEIVEKYDGDTGSLWSHNPRYRK